MTRDMHPPPHMTYDMQVVIVPGPLIQTLPKLHTQVLKLN